MKQVRTTTKTQSSNLRVGSTLGITVLELLIASAILIIILAATAMLFARGQEANAVSESITDRQQTIQTAINLFRYELSMAGYRGTCKESLTRDFADSTFVLSRGGNSDDLTVRYYEDRWPAAGCGTLRTTRLFVDETESVLYIQRDSGTAEPALENVHSVRVVDFVDRQGGNPENIPAAGFIGVNIRVEYEDPIGSFTQFVVGVKNPQHDPEEN